MRHGCSSSRTTPARPARRRGTQRRLGRPLCADGERHSTPLRTVLDVMVSTVGSPAWTAPRWSQPSDGDASSTPLLLLTALGEVHDRVSGLDAGANDYLVKPFDFDELTARLRALIRDYSGIGASIEIGSQSICHHENSITSPYAGRVMLTEKETALLRLLAGEPSRAFTRQHLLSAVFDNGEQLGTVDTYVHYIRRKTDRDLISTVRGVGYRLGTPA